jgi:hypothetical protein
MPKVNPIATFLLANVTFAILLAVGLLLGTSSDVHPLYLIFLFALCTNPIISMRYLNDQYVLLALFAAAYFMFYGFQDFASLFFNSERPRTPDGVLSKAEIAILFGGILANGGYYIACRSGRTSKIKPATDWPERTLILVGGMLWLLCTWATWKFRVYVLVDSSNEATTRGLASLNGVQIAGFIIAGLLQPVGILILAYTQCRYHRWYMIPVLVCVVLVQLVFGFVVDVKGDALIGAALVVVTKVLIDGKIPRLWIISFIAFLAVAFPVLQANRAARSEYGLNHVQVAQHIGDAIKKAVTQSRRPTTKADRPQTAFERMSLKGSVELIVSNTGKSVPFENGYTLFPLAAALIPRLLWPTKPDVPTGQVMNQAFSVSGAADTYISPSHLGELYWNFGWTGIALGMPLIGLLLGTIATRCDLSQGIGITRLLIIVVTIRLLILGFEGAIAVQYSQWIRSMLAIGLLHVFLSRKVPQEKTRDGKKLSVNMRSKQTSAQAAFPNLMR